MHRATGWWLAASAVLNAGWILAFAARDILLAEVLILALLAVLARVFGRLSRERASGTVERAVLRFPVALYTGWVSLAVVAGTAATGVRLGLPGDGALATIAAVLILLVAAGIVARVATSGTAVVGYSAAVVWALAGIALDEPPAAVGVAAAVASVVVLFCHGAADQHLRRPPPGRVGLSPPSGAPGSGAEPRAPGTSGERKGGKGCIHRGGGVGSEGRRSTDFRSGAPMRRSTLALGGALAIAAALTAGTATASAAAQETGSVYVVHGIPDTPVDVYVDGKKAIDDFKPISEQGPVDLPAGPTRSRCSPADAADGSGTPVLSASTRRARRRQRHAGGAPDADGKPKVTPFKNDVGRGRGRTGPAGGAAHRRRAGGGRARGRQARDPGADQPATEGAEVPAGSVSAAVAAAGTTDPVIGPADVDLKEGTATFVHAIGSLQDKSLHWSASRCRTCTARRPA